MISDKGQLKISSGFCTISRKKGKTATCNTAIIIIFAII